MASTKCRISQACDIAQWPRRFDKSAVEARHRAPRVAHNLGLVERPLCVPCLCAGKRPARPVPVTRLSLTTFYSYARRGAGGVGFLAAEEKVVESCEWLYERKECSRRCRTRIRRAVGRW